MTRIITHICWALAVCKADTNALYRWSYLIFPMKLWSKFYPYSMDKKITALKSLSKHQNSTADECNSGIWFPRSWSPQFTLSAMTLLLLVSDGFHPCEALPDSAWCLPNMTLDIASLLHWLLCCSCKPENWMPCFSCMCQHSPNQLSKCPSLQTPPLFKLNKN